MKNTATFSECRNYRYALWRSWDKSKPLVMFIGLNPSTADETHDDATLTRCITFSKSWGYGRVCMANLFAFCATEPKIMKCAKNPIGKDNDLWLKKLSKNADLIIGAWGNDGSFMNRSEKVIDLIPNLHYLKINKSGEFAHPLYLSSQLLPKPINDQSQIVR